MVESPVITALIAGATGIGGFVSGYFFLKQRMNYEVRTRHFDDIKKTVIEPIINQLELYYVPILNRDTSCLTNTSSRIQTDKVVIDNVPQYEYSLEIVNLEGSYPDLLSRLNIRYKLQEDVSERVKHIGLDSILLEDAETKHFSDAFKRWRALLDNYNKFAQKCLNTALNIEKQILENLGMPKYQHNLDRSIHSEFTALYIFEVKLGVYRSQLLPRDNDNRVDSDRGGELLKGPKEDRDRFIQYVREKVLHEDPDIMSLRNEANTLLELANSILKEMKAIQKLAKLHGRCKFVAI
ncbi:MAG: hypothetical protein HMLIMOIP_002334 [Candidatus Nitrosomirales archaeon]|jgi:hypothetical protein